MMYAVSAEQRPVPTPVDRDEALSILFREHYTSLLRLAALLVDQRAAAEDVVQDAFVKLHRSWHRVRDLERAPAYLRSIVLNTARSRLRRRRVAERHRPDPLPDAASAEAAAMLSDDQRAVIDALRELPRRQRECVALRYYCDLSEAEIAETLGISRGSVKSHSHRALSALSSRLEALR